ncbi:MAG TPA: glycine--tRNA ligase subunit beta, partial [Steroidobacteraceae bacterium]|nr:glycine--tRNA ligase subunit beta [Steroidobacteraceae bacterium]
EGLKPGALTTVLVPLLVQQSLDALPIAKRMRWGSGEAQFVRPVHWLVLLYGRTLVPATVLGVHAETSSRGHRFMAPRALRIGSPASYERTLQQRGKVIASFGQRRAAVRAQVEALAQRLGGRAIVPEQLLDEVTALVEWPVAIAGEFEPRFLALPREVLLSTLQEHQRYFALENDSGALLPFFVTVSNLESPEPELVRAGNERVVRPRLADAAFFWEQDRRQPLAQRRAGLDAVSFQAQLGSIGDRTARIAALAGTIGSALGAPPADTARAAQLCKCDLLTAMVGEFPELQGIMGRYYAREDGEPAAVAQAIAEHYLPRGAGDELPGSPVGICVALADKLDVLAGIFAAGQRPSGTRDPFGLRRAAIGLTRIVLEHRLVLDLRSLLDQAVLLQPLPDIRERAAQLASELYEFVFERLRGQYLERAADNGVTIEAFDAVLATRPRSLLDFDARLRALIAFLGRPEAASLAAVNKRIANILRKSAAPTTVAVRIDALQPGPELALHRALQSARPEVEAAVAGGLYAQGLDRLASLSPAIDAFFDAVLVNDPDEGLRRNRLALLEGVRTLFGGIADFSALPG